MGNRQSEVRAAAVEAGAGYRLGRFMLAQLFRITGGLMVEGKAGIAPAGPLIIVANHVSVVDGFVLVAAFPRRLVSLSAAYLFDRPVIGSFLRWFGAIPVEGGSGGAFGVRRALRFLEAGGALMIFPEGGVSPEPRPFESGWAYLALKSGATVLPVGIRGSDRLLPRGARCPRRAKVELVIGLPFAVARTGRPRREAVNALNTVVEGRVRRLCAGVWDDPDPEAREVKTDQ